MVTKKKIFIILLLVLIVGGIFGMGLIWKEGRFRFDREKIA